MRGLDLPMNTIPERITDSQVMGLLKSNSIDWTYVQFAKEFTNVRDELLSEWLNVSVKTFRSYKKKDAELKDNLKEHVILLISLFKHGQEVFGDQLNFLNWLKANNFHLDDEQPIDYLNTVSGIRFIDDRLTAMEFGDNV